MRVNRDESNPSNLAPVLMAIDVEVHMEWAAFKELIHKLPGSD
jgi:hypothetical protein